MIDHGWIKKGEKGPFYIKKFEVFLPPHKTDARVPFRVESEITAIKDSMNGKQYKFDRPIKFQLRYDENHIWPQSCKEKIEPYSTCWNKRRFPICIKRSDILPGPFYPTTNALWKLKIRSKYEFPKIHHTTPFYLQARIQLCSKSFDEDHRRKRRSPSFYHYAPACCNTNQYLDVKTRVTASSPDPCKPCPSGAPKMGGYFCQDCPVGMEPASGAYGCRSKNVLRSK
uniref:Uncharacterized protein n=1 Tax=Clytia hemisphaerica TaxID=252671 RepID=A0A7M5UYW8_9CNID